MRGEERREAKSPNKPVGQRGPSLAGLGGGAGADAPLLPTRCQPGVLPCRKPGASYLLITVTFVWVSAPPREAALSPPGTHSPLGTARASSRGALAPAAHPQLRGPRCTSPHKEPERRGGGGEGGDKGLACCVASFL